MHCGVMEKNNGKCDENNGDNQGRRNVGHEEVTNCAIQKICSGDGGLSEISYNDFVGIDDHGRTSHNRPISLEPPSLMSDRIGGMIDDSYGVPLFLIKLYLMVDDKATDSIISWGSSCTTFIISDDRRFISDILPCYFKTNNFNNFISQLNNYGFKKKDGNQLEFEHKNFQEGKLHLLRTIKRKKQQSNDINKSYVPLNEIKATFGVASHRQNQISNNIRRSKYAIEQTLLEVQTITKGIVNKFLFTFSETIGQKRTILDNGLSCDVGCLQMFSDLTDKMITRYDGKSDKGGTCGVGDGVGCCIPKFLHKLYTMVTKKEIDDFISWTLPYCDRFTIWDINKFATHVLPMYFKHTNFSSFNSQLNKYGFKKVNWEKHEYANEWFREGRYDLLANIKRRSKSLRLMRCTKTWSTTEVEMLNHRLKIIQQDQKNKIILLSNYEEHMKTFMLELKETIINMSNVVDNMILKSNENDENVKKAKLAIENTIIGNEKEKESEANEHEIGSSDDNKLENQSYFQELGFDTKAVEKAIMEDIWIRSMDN
ncbi:hypothetical protein E3N88_07776 [Mikania micrantha]|uniref:HSF-type DNA-binding domain-containing protein n=1 Tax=Mikania micrantha TaxID=192012 RepID=A0A5N6PGC8_9ASTR|nr:hypothetical protein E3N88_07776 [Mikania micrantha]